VRKLTSSCFDLKPLQKQGVPLLLAVGALSLISGCVHEDYASKAGQVLPVPESFPAEYLPDDDKVAANWAETLNAPVLKEYIAEAYDENFQLQALAYRIQEAEAMLKQAAAADLPVLSMQAGAADGKREVPSRGTMSTVEAEEYELALAARWEVDLWDRLGQRENASRLERDAREADLQALKVRLNANISQAFFGYLAARQRFSIIEEQAERAGDQLELLETRFEKGAGTALDLSRQAQRVESFQESLVRLQESAEQSRHALAILVGNDPQRMAIEDAVLPDPPSIPAAGFPADLLLTRPDLRAAFLRLKASDARRASAAAERLPELQLSLRGLTRAGAISQLFESFLWSIAGEAAQTLFDFGATEARVQAAEARAGAALAEFGQSWLDALKDVSDAFLRIQASDALLETVRAQLRMARDNRRLSRERYLRGEVGFLRLLDADQTTDELEQREIQTRLEQILARVQLIRALGRTWMHREPPKLDS
jgi:multidrug efflux system outer membrane protein